MKPKQLLTAHYMNVGAVNGNCGSRVLYRVTGTYCTPWQADKRMKELVATKTLRKISTRGSNDRKAAIAKILANLRRAETGESTTYDGVLARAYPVEWGFYACLEALASSESPGLWILTDTEHGRGDGHKGIFATRHFAQWLYDQELAYEQAKVTGIKGRGHLNRKMFAWSFAPDYRKIKAVLNAGRKEIMLQVKEWNDDPLIKEAENARKQEALESRRIIQQGWAESGIDTSRQGPVPARTSAQEGLGLGRSYIDEWITEAVEFEEEATGPVEIPSIDHLRGLRPAALERAWLSLTPEQQGALPARDRELIIETIQSRTR